MLWKVKNGKIAEFWELSQGQIFKGLTPIFRSISSIEWSTFGPFCTMIWVLQVPWLRSQSQSVFQRKAKSPPSYHGPLPLLVSMKIPTGYYCITVLYKSTQYKRRLLVFKILCSGLVFFFGFQHFSRIKNLLIHTFLFALLLYLLFIREWFSL